MIGEYHKVLVTGSNWEIGKHIISRLVRQTKEEFVRKGAFSRIFPSEDSWDLYSQFLENKTHYNFMLHSQLYPNRWVHRATALYCVHFNRTSYICITLGNQIKNPFKILKSSRKLFVCSCILFCSYRILKF